MIIPEHLSSYTVFDGVRVARSLVFCALFCRSLLVFWSLYCLFFFDIRRLATPLVSSSFSFKIRLMSEQNLANVGTKLSLCRNKT